MVKISALPPAASGDGDDELPFVDDSATTTKKITFTVLKEWFQSLAGWITTAMFADGSATDAKWRNEVAFAARRTTAQSIGDVTFTKIQADAESYDLGANYDTSTNYRFTAPVDGVYHFDGSITLLGLADGNRVLATLFVDGTEFHRGDDVRMGSSGDGGTGVSADIGLTAGQYVELYVYYDGTGSKNTLAAAYANKFSGHLVTRV